MSLIQKAKVEKLIFITFFLFLLLDIYSNVIIINSAEKDKVSNLHRKTEENKQENPNLSSNEDNSKEENFKKEEEIFQEEKIDNKQNLQEETLDINKENLQEGKSKYKEVKIFYCTSWSYKHTFQQAYNIIKSNFPELEVSGREFPPDPTNKSISSIIWIIQILIAIILLVGDQIFNYLNINPPNIYLKIREKKLLVFFILFFIGNGIHQNLLKTGAFEIQLDEKIIFSKIQTGRMPSGAEIIDEIKKMVQ